MELTLAKGERKFLRTLGYDENWLHKRIEDDPSILGLGNLRTIRHERNQPTGGRIDFLMCDTDDEENYYEIEVMLGKLDESHIIRTIEYWDIERKRYPHMEHCAVIVAEEITSRFFNVISLLNPALPIIALQLNAILVENKLILHFTKILDTSELCPVSGPGSPDNDPPTNREYWEKLLKPSVLAIFDKIVRLVPEPAGPRRVAYNKGHIAVGTSGVHFAWFNPRKNGWSLELRISGDDQAEWIAKLDEAEIEAKGYEYLIRMRVTQNELAVNEGLIRDILVRCEELSRRE